MDKPTDHRDNRNSIDRELYNMSYKDKKSNEDMTMRALQKSSIELDVCSCKKIATGGVACSTAGGLVIRAPPKKSAAAEKKVYVAPPPAPVAESGPKLEDDDLKEIFDF